MTICACGCGQAVGENGETANFQRGHFAVPHNRITLLSEDRGFATPCLIWPGSRNPRGYGRRASGFTHRQEWERRHGPVPDGLVLDHLCRVRECCNPDHLELVTHSENVRRGWRARRAGDKTGNWRLRDARLAARLTQGDLAELLGVSQSLVTLWERHSAPWGHAYSRPRREQRPRAA